MLNVSLGRGMLERATSGTSICNCGDKSGNNEDIG